MSALASVTYDGVLIELWEASAVDGEFTKDRVVRAELTRNGKTVGAVMPAAFFLNLDIVAAHVNHLYEKAIVAEHSA